MQSFSPTRAIRIASDVGGTFTDIVAFDEANGEILYGKTLTTPRNLVDGIVEGVNKAGVGADRTRLFLHGTTIAINTVLERSGARTALLTTKGFRDVYEIGRINRPQAYNLFFRKHEPLIRRSWRYEIDERIDAAGEVLKALDEAELAAVAAELRRQDIAAVAVLFFHSYRNPTHELRAKELLQRHLPGVYVCASHELSQEYREYERTSTVAANAYIGPRIAAYLGDIEARLKAEKLHGPFFVVQSNGGLFDAARAQRECVRMLESGPAAGVVGAQAICARLGLASAIAFDMGGTTAKAGVVYAGEPMMAGSIMVGGYETGLPIQIPLIDIQEVGTGGGSIAYIEPGGGLRVGPQSAGAAPGPVCYGLGGEQPTVTDANLVLGCLSKDNFLGGEMKLDLNKASAALHDLAARLGLSITDAASGIIRIASTTMSQVVTRVTTERGLDAGDFAMVAYGGAGPLHACLVARELSIPTVIIPPSPGHFSAYGMLMADLRRDFVRTWFRPVATLDFEEMERLYAEMEADGTRDVAPHVEGSGRIAAARSADMRYVNQEHSVTVELPASLFHAKDRAALKRHFDDEHMKRYGFNSPADPAEIVSLYSAVIGRLDKPRARPISKACADATPPEPIARRPVYFAGGTGYVPTPVYDRACLTCGERIEGPALIEEYASTTLLLPGDRLEVGEFGDLVIAIAREQTAAAAGGRPLRAGRTGKRREDPVVTEIVRNSVVAITEEMKSNLMRTACSMIIYEAQDFTVGLFDARGDTVSIGIGLPMFVHGMSYTVKAMLAHFKPEGMEPGDVLVTNDAYITGSHLNHVTLCVPIFHEDALVGFSACMAHWADIGAALNIVTRDIYSEGLQLPMLKMYRAGAVNEDLLAIMRMNVRIPERAMGDLNAQIAAVRTGAKRFLELIARYGRDGVLEGIAAIMDRSEVQARQQVATIPDGEYYGESFMDDDAVDQGKRVPIRVKVVVRGDQMTVDLSQVSLQVKGFYNSGESAGISCCQVAFKCITSPLEKPINEGSFRALEVILPKGTIVSAVKPAPMMKWMTYPMTVADTIFKTLAQAIPQRVIAGHHADLMSVHINGKMPRDGRLFIVNGGLIGGGWGATDNGDGSHVTICINDGDTHNSPLEQLEAKYPMIVERYALREDSGGAGRHQGGLGAEFVCRAAGAFMFNAGVERVHCRPWGLFDGHPGAGNEVSVRLGTSEELRFPSGKVYGRELEPGDAYILRSGGGGGYGSPLERSLAQIELDLREGYISRRRAEGCYGVCFDAAGRIDAKATAARRAKLRANGEFTDHLARLEASGAAPDRDAAAERLLTQGQLFPLRCC